MDLQKLYEIFNWLGNKELYETGVTNKQVIETNEQRLDRLIKRLS